MKPLRGSLWAFLFYDVSEEIRLDRARDLLGGVPLERKPEFRGPSPEYVRFARPPIHYPADAIRTAGGENWSAAIKIYDYGIVSVALELPFEGGWDELVQLCARWIASPDIERNAIEIARAQTARIAAALVKPYANWTTEDYYAVYLRDCSGIDGNALAAADLVAQYGDRIARIVRGESARLSDLEIEEILRQRISYYPTDLLVVAWMAAFVYDTPEGAAPILQLLEYANTQLLEFRHYDDLLSSVLATVYDKLERRRGVLGRWKLARDAAQLNFIRLEVTELTERVDNSIKFLSDMFYARAYRLAALKIGVTDYRDLVDEKLRTAGELYQSMIDEFHQARAFLLEVMVVAILVIELVFLFRGKS